MGYEIELQDDTGLRAQADFRYSESKGLAYALYKLPIIATLEQQIGLSLTPLRQVGCDWEDQIEWGAARWDDLANPDPARDAMLQAQLRELQNELAATWQPPDALRQAIVQLLSALAALPPQTITALCESVPAEPPQRDFVTTYLGEGSLRKDLESVLLMLHWAELRGATRVRLVIR